MTLHLQPLSLKPFFEDVIRLIDRQSAEAGVTVLLEMSDDTLSAVMDADKMRQVMLNLFLNALDAMQAGGALTVRVLASGVDRMHIQVVDTGKGIDPTDQPHIFEPYYSTKTTGTGIGLAIVHNIVKAHRGDIWVDSRPGCGTTIGITLPTAKEA